MSPKDISLSVIHFQRFLVGLKFFLCDSRIALTDNNHDNNKFRETNAMSVRNVADNARTH